MRGKTGENRGKPTIGRLAGVIIPLGLQPVGRGPINVTRRPALQRHDYHITGLGAANQSGWPVSSDLITIRVDSDCPREGKRWEYAMRTESLQPDILPCRLYKEYARE